MEKLTFEEFQKIMVERVEKNYQTRANEEISGIIVLKEGTFDTVKQLTETQRSFHVDSSAKYFDWRMGGTGLFGTCLDSSWYYLDGWPLVLRLNDFIAGIEYCYID